MKSSATILTILTAVFAGLATITKPPWWALAAVTGVGIASFTFASERRRDRATRTRPVGVQYQYRALWLVAAGVQAGQVHRLSAGLAVGVGLVLILAEPVLVRTWARLSIPAANLPGAPQSRGVRAGITAYIALTLLATAVLLFSVPGGEPVVWLSTGLNVLAGAFVVGLSVYARNFADTRQEEVWAALDAQKPAFALYFSAPPRSEHQVHMWLPYLEQIGQRWVILLREARYLPLVSKLTDRPVIVAASLGNLDRAMIESISAVFYVNNGYKNSHCVRYADRVHIQLLHGDSDKPSSFNPVTAMFDRIFVAGQAGIDRYAKHGVNISEEKFDIVGRPQIASILPAGATTPIETILYAPTWQGFQDDANFSSLPYAQDIIDGLLAAGLRVIFRPHPASENHSDSMRTVEWIHQRLARGGRGIEHVFGREAMSELDLVDCINASDALVSDISSVPGDYLFSGKPQITVKTLTDVSDEVFLEEYPLTRASYLWSPHEGAFKDVLQRMLTEDPLREERRRIRNYYLGDFPASGYADHFIHAAQRVLADAQSQRAPLTTQRSGPPA